MCEIGDSDGGVAADSYLLVALLEIHVFWRAAPEILVLMWSC